MVIKAYKLSSVIKAVNFTRRRTSMTQQRKCNVLLNDLKPYTRTRWLFLAHGICFNT